MKGREKEGKGRDVNYVLGSNFDELWLMPGCWWVMIDCQVYICFSVCIIKSNHNHMKAKSKLT